MSVKAAVETLKLMKAGKAAGPTDVTSELLKVCKNEKEVGRSG